MLALSDEIARDDGDDYAPGASDTWQCKEVEVIVWIVVLAPGFSVASSSKSSYRRFLITGHRMAMVEKNYSWRRAC